MRGWHIAFTLATTLALPAESQTIQGVVLDSETGSPIVAVEVVLLTRVDTVVGRSVTGESGRFAFYAPGPGLYRIRANRIGYGELSMDSITASADQEISLELRLKLNPIGLPRLNVERTRRESGLDRVGFYKRMAKSVGYFRSPAEIAQLDLAFPEALFDGIPGIRAIRDSAVVSLSRHGRCALTVAVDGMVLQGAWREAVNVNDILALEVYPRPSGLPVWLAGSVSPCGAVVIWTK